MLNEKQVQEAEDQFVKMTFVLGMMVNSLATAYSALTRIPQALPVKIPQYREVIAQMRLATAQRKTEEERKSAYRALDDIDGILNVFEKLAVNPEALSTVKEILDFHQKLNEESLKEAKASDPGVQ